MTTGETISAGMSLLSLAVHAAFDLGLNRDPVQGGQSGYSFREREERRRTFWCLFALSMTITTVGSLLPNTSSPAFVIEQRAFT